jgi:hypothetical protein
MGRFLWAWGLSWLFLLSFATSARADGAGGLAEIRVCVRPPNVPPGLAEWGYTPGSAIVLMDRATFRARNRGQTVYVFDPAAPAANTRLLPIPFNTLPCPPRVLPTKAPAVPPPPPPPAPAAAGKPGAAPKPGDKPPATEKGKAPLPLPQPLPEPSRAPEQHRPRPPPGGALPETVLPVATVLPFVRKSWFDKVAEELAYGSAIANQQLNEDTHRPDGKQYGIPGGKNPDGPNSAVAQAGAGVVLVVVAVLAAGGFEKKLKDALKAGKALLIKDTGKLGEQAAEKFIQECVAKEGPKGAAYIADALNKNGTIGEYSVMAKFTEGMGGKVQAHHILEQKFVKKFTLGNADKVPSVILTEAEHKAMTATLKAETAKAETVQELWEAYQRAYVDHPGWLKAIESYFVKGK